MSRNGKANRSAALVAVGLLFSCNVVLAAETPAYPPVFEQPPASAKPALTKDEQSKVRDDLVKARDRQSSQTKTRDATPTPKSKTSK
ncbi:MAG TPA: hypothetical protein VFL62_11720 [Bradyrhizobium sp.]|uniref:hypothetical protein n=1 Tax=Bradyrhizobium sp. TaxID=376 RepID=UPI002D7E7B6F|nr:hypothetical protein [Bradyrhizobium sp.]HET7886885.1 hypothetical protein [Bradyrhizobium sp.]